MKKIFSAIMSFVFISSLIFTVACAQQEEEVFDRDFNVELEVDLTGQTYKWGSSWHEQLISSVDFSIAGDMTHKRLNDLTEKYGCTFEVVNWEDGSSKILQEVAAGYNTIDFLDSHASNGGIQLYKANLLYSLDEIPNIDMSDNKYGSPRFLQYGIFDGKNYGFYQFAWEFPPEYHGVIHFNSEMLSSLGISLPHELMENGNWDWTNFKEYLLSIQSASASAGYGDFVPFICGSSYSADAIALMFANGCKMVEGSSEQGYSFGFDNSAGIAAIEFMADLYKEGLYVQKGHAEFVKNQKSALMSHESYFSTHYNEKSSSNDYLPAQDYAYGLIRFPHGPNGDENSVSSYVHHGRRLNWVLNSSGKDVSDIGLVMEFVFATLDGSDGWSGLLKDQILYTKEDHFEYSYMLENINFNYGTMFLGKGYDTLVSGLNSAVTGRKSIAEAFSAARASIDEGIKENVTWVYEELVE